MTHRAAPVGLCVIPDRLPTARLVAADLTDETMSSRPASPASGSSLLLRLAPLLLPLLLSSLDSAEGASFRDYRLRGSKPPREPPHRGPDQDMLKALRHIENLRHRSGRPPSLRLQKPPHGAPGYDGGLLDNAQALRAMLTLRALEQGPKEEEELEGEENPEQGDKTQEWFQAVLRALERTGPANTAHQPAWGRGPGLRLGERAAASQEATRMMFEEEDGEKGKEEEGTYEEQEAAAEEGKGDERGNPLVRPTGEGVGEKYTPQKLATLQSIFDEVERLATGGKEEEEKGGVGEEGQQKENLNMRSLAYDKVARGLVDWGEEEVEGDEEEEEEQRGSKPQADQVLDYGDDGEDEDIDVEEEDGEDLSARRSINPQPTEDAEDMANLVDYYLLKVLEKTEEEDKREIEEEQKERAERKVSQFQYWDNRSPQQDMHQLLRLSQKYHIPPEELLALFQAEDRSKPRSQTTPPQSSGLARSHNRIFKKQPSLGSKQNNRYRTPERPSSYKAKDARTLEILSLLGLGSTGGPGPLKRPPPYQVSQPQFQPQPRRQEKYTPAQSPGTPNKLKENYDDNVGEDELAAYMAAKILEQYPAAPMYKKTGQKRSALGLVWPDEDEEQGGLGSLEQAMQDYFDQIDSDRAAQQQQKRQSEREGPGGVAQTQGPDDDALMRMMTLLTPEGQASQEK
ncbi:secretogranin-2a [Gadus chalcogrammus]|uniref:secretogranin-2a n=1 Tax=Gadus chalcogrammus TaxID=1042646 RepID=UPI0024C49FF9|nr:secretogranin-2a [Gadus chalcogrammus]